MINSIFNKPVLIALGILIFLLIITAVATSPTFNKLPVASPKPYVTLPLNPDNLPLQDPTNGSDSSLTLLQMSTLEIKKLEPSLPFEQNKTLSTGLPVDISIYSTKNQSVPWQLDVQIYGIKYESQPTDKDYDQMKKSFQESSQFVFDWIRSKGADPTKIIISWGDQKFIRDQAQEWLKNP